MQNYKELFGNAIGEARRKQNITQKQLAEMSGIPRPNISKIEAGRLNPSLSILQQLLPPLGIEIKLKF